MENILTNPNIIKVEPMRQENLFYERGDILLAGTDKFRPWPCIVDKFLGYDQRQVQVYRVDFLQTNEYSNLETEFLIPITKTKLKRLRNSKNYMNKRNTYMRALDEAEKKIKEYQLRAKDDEQKMFRFMKLYQSDKNEVNGFIQVESVKLMTEADLQEKQKRLKRHRLRVQKQMSLSIKNEVSKNLVTTVINNQGRYFTTNYNLKEYLKSEKRGNEILIDIKNWSAHSEESMQAQ